MTTNRKINLRRQYWINKRFQTRFILFFILLVISGMALSTGLVLSGFRGHLTTLSADTGLSVTDTLTYSIPAMVAANLITLVTISIFMISMTLLVSHRIAGPLYRIESDTAKIADGNLAHRICLRKGDQFRELCVDINRMTENLNTRISEIRCELQEIIDAATEGHAPAMFRDDLIQLREKMDSFFGGLS